MLFIIFTHYLVRWSPDNEFSNVRINYPPHYPGGTNYWPEISPILESLPNQVVIFAGDMGAKPSVDSYMYHSYKNITLIAIGMGGGIDDNVVVTEVGEEGELRFRLLGISDGSLFDLADLKEYELP